MASKKTSKKKSIAKKVAKKAAAKQAAKTSMTKKTAKKATATKVAQKPSAKKVAQKPAAKKVAQKPAAKKVAQKPAAKKVAQKPTAKKVKKKERQPPISSSATQSALPGEGDRVPQFSLANQDGQMLDSSSLAGERYVLYFYPKDDTPGCTTEACGFRDEFTQFAQAKVRIIGVSPDKPAAHQRFAAKYSLPFTLLCDPDHTLSTGLGVWALKNNYGREYMGIVRSTFLVNENGVIEKVWRNVRVPGHVPAVLEAATQS